MEDILIRDLSKEQYIDLLLDEDVILQEDGAISKWLKNKWKDVSDKFDYQFSETLLYQDKQIEELKKVLYPITDIKQIENLTKVGNYTTKFSCELLNDAKPFEFDFHKKNFYRLYTCMMLLSAIVNYHNKFKDNKGEKDEFKFKQKEEFKSVHLDKVQLNRCISLIFGTEAANSMKLDDYRSTFTYNSKKETVSLDVRGKFSIECKHKEGTTFKPLTEFESLKKELENNSIDDSALLSQLRDLTNTYAIEVDDKPFDPDVSFKDNTTLASDYIKNLETNDQHVLLDRIKGSIFNKFSEDIYANKYKINFSDVVDNLKLECSFDVIDYELADKDDRNPNKYKTGKDTNILNYIAKEVNKSEGNLEEGIEGFVPGFKASWKLKINFPKEEIDNKDNGVKKLSEILSKQVKQLKLFFGDNLPTKEEGKLDFVKLKNIVNKLVKEPLSYNRKTGKIRLFIDNNRKMLEKFKSLESDYNKIESKYLELRKSGKKKGTDEDLKILQTGQLYQEYENKKANFEKILEEFYDKIIPLIDDVEDEEKKINELQTTTSNDVVTDEIKVKVKKSLVDLLARPDNVKVGLLKITNRKDDREFTFDNNLVYVDRDTGKQYPYNLELFVKKEGL